MNAGMNEILGPLYYIFASDPTQNFKGNFFKGIYNLKISSNFNIP